MSLSNDLISQFVKITKDQTVEKKESIVYGTTVNYNDKMYVKIDGSDLLTPVETTADMEAGERVTVMIKDHTATVTGNVTSPSASSTKVNKLTEDLLEVDTLIAEKASITDLEAANAKINNLEAKDADIEKLIAEKASIEDLNATNANITNLQAKDAEIENLVADKASITDLEAVNAEIVSLKADKADIKVLDAIYADIDILNGQVADIDTLVNGNLTSENIQSLHLTVDNVTIDNALIKDAMIDSVSANKINVGVLNTNNVTIQSDDGSMLLQGNLQQFKDENGNVRIQIGKDASGNFTFVLYDENGTGQLINQNGIQSSDAIADGLIVDAKVAEGANIKGSKLDINSVVTEINNGDTTIKGTKIYLDDQAQSLEVAFNSLSTKVENINTATGDLGSLVEQVETNTTNIEIAQGQISSLITNTTITSEDGTVTQLKDAYNSTVDTVNSHTTTIGQLETNYDSLSGEISNVSNKQTSLEQDLSGFKTTVSETYATQKTVSDLSDNLTNNYSTTTQMNSAINQKANEITSTVSTTYTTKTDFNNLTIGGRNLLLNSNEEITNNSYSMVNYTPSMLLEVGQTYTMTICVTPASGVTYYTPYVSDGTIRLCQLPVSGTEKQIISTVFTFSYGYNPDRFPTSPTDGYARVTIYRFPNDGTVVDNSTIHWVKLEQGNKATDWSPAPEDIDTQFTTVTASISEVKQTADKINWLVASGTSSANMTLTSDAYSVIANNIDLTGKVTFSCLDNPTQTTINTLNSNSSNWTNAYNRVVEWASGAITSSTTINGGLIATNTVLADRIAIGDFTNYVSDPSFENGVYTNNGTWSISTEQAHTGSKSLKSDCTGSYGSYALSKKFNVRYGQKFYVEWYQYRTTAVETYNIDICVYNNDGSINVYDITDNYIPPASETTNQWNKYSYVGTIYVDGYAQVIAKHRVDSTDTGAIYFDDITVRNMATGELIVDGSITADKIQGQELVGITLRNSTSTFVVDGDGNITGASITNSTGDNWEIDTQGNMTVQNISIEGEVSTDTITCNKINNPNYPESLSADTLVYVNASTGSDDAVFEDGATFASINGVLDACPRNLNNYVLYVRLMSNTTENVVIHNINTGILHIQMNCFTIYGYINATQNMGLQLKIYGAIGSDDTYSSGSYKTGYIAPSIGCVTTGGAYAVVASDTFSFTCYHVAAYAPTVTQTNSDGSTTYAKAMFCIKNFTKAYLNTVEALNSVSDSTFTGFANMIRSYSCANVYVSQSAGLTSNYTFFAQSGSTIALANAYQCGRYDGGDKVRINTGGQIISCTASTPTTTGITWNTSTGSSTSSAGSSTTTTKTVTYTSNYGDTYRSTVYNNWKKDGTVRQGDYGYGDCNGCWFFGTQLAEVKGKTITKVQITITRQSGGTSSAIALAIKTHNYSVRPSGTPSYVGSVGSLSIATGASGTLTITDTSNSIITGLIAGTIKGIGLQSSYTSALYAVCSGSCKIKITYTDTE